jgi:hypothetical protein
MLKYKTKEINIDLEGKENIVEMNNKITISFNL